MLIVILSVSTKRRQSNDDLKGGSTIISVGCLADGLIIQ
jgi:hypothetical protein